MPTAFKVRLTLPRRCLSDVYQSLPIMSANKLITLILIHCFGSLAGRAGYTYHNLSIFAKMVQVAALSPDTPQSVFPLSRG